MTKEELDNYVEKSRRCRIYIKRLPIYFDNESLLELFSKYGKVTKAYCVSGTKIRKNLKYGYVLFEEEATIDLLPISGVPYANSKLLWTCHKHKMEKRKVREENIKKFSMSQARPFKPANLNARPGRPVRPRLNMSPRPQHIADDCMTLAPQDKAYYSYLKCKNMFENADYHAVKPTNMNYQVSAQPSLAHYGLNMRLNNGNTFFRTVQQRNQARPSRFNANRFFKNVNRGGNYNAFSLY
jgi:RNA recognition motif-containing protein